VESSPATIQFDAAWSDTPFKADTGLKDQTYRVVAPDGSAAKAALVAEGKSKSTAKAKLSAEGTYCLEAIDPQRHWTQVERNGGKKWLLKRRREVKGEKIIRADVYWSKACSYVTVGKAADKMPPPSDDPLMVTPTLHPSRIVANRPVSLIVTRQGKPLAGAVVKVFTRQSKGHEGEQELKTNAQGLCEFVPTEAGPLLLACELEESADDDKDADFRLLQVYLTVCVFEPPN